MKKLQNNFTTPEQSKRLLKLGVPKDSAYLMYDISEIEHQTYDFPTFVYGRFSRYAYGLYVPCWSVGRLIEIFNECSNWNTVSMTSVTNETYIYRAVN